MHRRLLKGSSGLSPSYPEIPSQITSPPGDIHPGGLTEQSRKTYPQRRSWLLGLSVDVVVMVPGQIRGKVVGNSHKSLQPLAQIRIRNIRGGFDGLDNHSCPIREVNSLWQPNVIVLDSCCNIHGSILAPFHPEANKGFHSSSTSHHSLLIPNSTFNIQNSLSLFHTSYAFTIVPDGTSASGLIIAPAAIQQPSPVSSFHGNVMSRRGVRECSGGF